MGRRLQTLEDIYRRVDAIEKDEYGCKRWPAPLGPLGQAYVQMNYKNYYVARIVLERKLGRAIRPGFFALHECDYAPCVNEDHLREGTNSDNMLDMWTRNPERRPTNY
jgi:hypothetical protein